MNDINELLLTPFSAEESKKDYTLNTFDEQGIKINILRDNSYVGLSSGTLYKFGLQDSNGNKFWFLNSQAYKGRQEARKIFAVLKHYCEKNNINGQPFMIKKK